MIYNTIYRINPILPIFTQDKKEQPDKEKRWLCVYCKTGVVIRFPARCPECKKLLNEEVVKK